MAIVSFDNIKISAISVCVPPQKITNREFGKTLFDNEESLVKTIDTIGVEERRVSSEQVCSSDLCFEAAQRLIDQMSIDLESIDAVLFVSQTPDYRLPATACVLQNRLGLSKSTLAFDVNLGCSGYVYGLYLAFSLINKNINRVLLLVGDTPTKFTSTKDKSSALIFGDAGSATLIESSESAVNSFFSLHTDGSGFEALNIPNGGYRNMSNPVGLSENRGIDGNFRNSEQLYMDGAEIFNFTIREVPKSIKLLFEEFSIDLDKIDKVYFHQANKFMLDFLLKKIKIGSDKMMFSLHKFGNTSAASIPLTIVFNEDNTAKDIVLMSGFGVGLSWANCITSLNETKILNLIEYAK